MTDNITQRDVLRGLGGLALTGAIGCGELDQSFAGVGTYQTATIAAVANQPIVISAVEAYAEKSLAAGETIYFRVSSPVAYELSIVRLGWDTDTPLDEKGFPLRDWTVYTFPRANAAQRSIRLMTFNRADRPIASSRPTRSSSCQAGHPVT